MRILYVTARPLEMNASSSIRNRATIRGLLELGHSVDLVTSTFDTNHPNFDQRVSIDDRLEVTYLDPGRMEGMARRARSIPVLGRLRNFMGGIAARWAVYDRSVGIVDHARRMDVHPGRYDLIISSSDPKSSHLFVHKMRRGGLVANVPWIQIWGDPFARDISRKRAASIARIQREEERLLASATQVIYVSRLTMEEQKKRYPRYASRMTSIPIAYLEGVVYPQHARGTGPLRLLYAGDYHAHVRDIRPLCDAVTDSSHELVVAGDGDPEMVSGDRISVSPRVGFDEMRELEASSDVLVHLSNRSGGQIPGKIYQISGTNRHILFILDGSSESIRAEFDQYGRYVFCNNSREEILSALSRIEQGDYEDRRFLVNDFRPEIVAQRIIDTASQRIG